MKLTGVTFTGVDERTDLRELCAISGEFPFVEWAVLVSTTRGGTEPRYPGLRRFFDFCALPVNKAMHVCGRMARDIAAGTGNLHPTLAEGGYSVQRVQVNLGRAIVEYPGWWARAETLGESFDGQVIVQTADFSNTIVQEAAGRVGNGRAAFLHDPSGGRGVSCSFEMPVNGDYVGYAGGFAPDNVAIRVEQLDTWILNNDFWIDMESGVRTDDWLDLAKCRQVLEAVRGFVGARP